LIPRRNVNELLAIEAPPISNQLPGRRSKSASSGSCLVKSSPLPPIASSSLSTDTDSIVDNSSVSTVTSGRPSSCSHVTGSSRLSAQQSSDEPPSESFFMTEVLTFNVSVTSSNLLTLLCYSQNVSCILPKLIVDVLVIFAVVLASLCAV